MSVSHWFSSHPGQHLPDKRQMTAVCRVSSADLSLVCSRGHQVTFPPFPIQPVAFGTGTHARYTQDNTPPSSWGGGQEPMTVWTTQTQFNIRETVSNFKPNVLCTACWIVLMVFEKKICVTCFQVRDKYVGYNTQDRREKGFVLSLYLTMRKKSNKLLILTVLSSF